METNTQWHAEVSTTDPAYQVKANFPLVIRCRAAELNHPKERAAAAICAVNNTPECARDSLKKFFGSMFAWRMLYGPEWEDTELGESSVASELISGAGFAPISPGDVLEHSPTKYRVQCVEKEVVEKMELFKLYKGNEIVIDCETEYEFEAYQFIALRHYNKLPGRAQNWSFSKPVHSEMTGGSTACEVESGHSIQRLLRAANVFVDLMLWDDLADLMYAMAGRTAESWTAASSVDTSLKEAAEKKALKDISVYIPPIIKDAMDVLCNDHGFLNASQAS